MKKRTAIAAIAAALIAALPMGVGAGDLAEKETASPVSQRAQASEAVFFRSSDPLLQKLYDSAAEKIQRHHNNLRSMYYGVFTQEMADAFIRHHLLNPEEFWTPTPIPSIAINEPLFKNVEGNNWSGQVQALEKYGHYAEVSLLGEKLIATWTKNEFRFTQQIDPFTGINSGLKPDYNITMTATCLAYLPRMFGIYPVVDQEEIWWSALACKGNDFHTTQRRGEMRYEMAVVKGRVTGSVNGKEVFTCTEGVRVVTDEQGSVLEVIGISREPVDFELSIGETKIRGRVLPNAVCGLRDGRLVQVRAVPFDYP